MSVKELYEKLGANYQEALSRLMNDALITRFIIKFAHSYNLDELKQAYLTNDNKRMFEVTHALKGVIGNLALTKLYNMVSSFCDLVREKDNSEKLDLANQMKELEDEFDFEVKEILSFETNK